MLSDLEKCLHVIICGKVSGSEIVSVGSSKVQRFPVHIKVCPIRDDKPRDFLGTVPTAVFARSYCGKARDSSSPVLCWQFRFLSPNIIQQRYLSFRLT